VSTHAHHLPVQNEETLPSPKGIPYAGKSANYKPAGNFHFHHFLSIRTQCFSLKTLVESVKNTCCAAYISGEKITNNKWDN